MGNDTLIAIGEALIDFIPNKKDCKFDDVTGFSPRTGGAPANVCGAFANLGGKAKMITQLGDDPFGHKILHELERENIDVSAVALTDKANTALAFVSLDAGGDRTFSFYRKPSADMLMSEEQICEKDFDNSYALHFCSVSLGNFPMKKAHEKAIEFARKSNAIISFDPNLRFQLWNDRNELKNAVDEFIPKADILKLSDDELEFITGETDIKKALPKLFVGNVKLIVYTCSDKGAYAFTKFCNTEAYRPSEKINSEKIVDTTGAGDGFIGAFLWMLKKCGITQSNLEQTDENTLGKCLEFSNKFCAVSIQSQGAISSYPTINQI